MDWKDWIGKTVFVQLKRGTVYTGKVIEASDGFLTLIDKYDSKVSFAATEIIRIGEEKPHGKNKSKN
jgi:small nuclear ribonucleoprotein (snRNP)-like protein